MSYRLLLQVPNGLVDQANIAVAQAGDAEVLLARNSHGLTFDDLYQDLSVAAQTLTIVGTLYNWLQQLDNADRGNISISLHSGQQIRLVESDAATVIAAIRYDQPWVEPSIPKIGDHMEDELAPDRWPMPPLDTTGELMAVESLPRVPHTTTDIVIPGVDYPLVRVNNMRRAEDFYGSVFGMGIQRRYRVTDDGELVEIEGQVSWADADRLGLAPVYSFLSSETMQLALQTVGIGIRLDLHSFDQRLAATVDPAILAHIKAQVLMNGYSLMSQTDDRLTFRDPFGVTWDLTTREAPRLTSTSASATTV